MGHPTVLILPLLVPVFISTLSSFFFSATFYLVPVLILTHLNILLDPVLILPLLNLFSYLFSPQPSVISILSSTYSSTLFYFYSLLNQLLNPLSFLFFSCKPSPLSKTQKLFIYCEGNLIFYNNYFKIL